MLNKLLRQIRCYNMVQPGDTVYCALSGGADSVALLWGLYLLRDTLGITLRAVHFNHCLRGEESQRDETFVKDLCQRYGIDLTVGSAEVKAGKKGLEASAREARYGFFATLPGKIATAHTADDNAETVLMHLVRGTGLKGLGGIAPVRGMLIRPMLGITRQEVLAFLAEYHLDYIQDSSNEEDVFLRNRLRHHVMPLLKQENPCLAENLSAMAMQLRDDEAQLYKLSAYDVLPDVEELKNMPAPIRSRMLEQFLKSQGVKEPERQHIALTEQLIFSENPSAKGQFPGGVTIGRNYGKLERICHANPLPETLLPSDGQIRLAGYDIIVTQGEHIENCRDVFTVRSMGPLRVRCRQEGDEIRLPGGTKSLKKLFIDAKIPAHLRSQIPVITDDCGILGVFGFGVNEERKANTLPALQIRIIKR